MRCADFWKSISQPKKLKNTVFIPHLKRMTDFIAEFTLVNFFVDVQCTTNPCQNGGCVTRLDGTQFCR